MSDVGEQEEQLGLPPGLLLGREARLADVMDESIHDAVQDVLHRRIVVEGLHRAGAERKGACWKTASSSQQRWEKTFHPDKTQTSQNWF